MDQRVGYCFGSRKVDGGADTPEVPDVPVHAGLAEERAIVTARLSNQ